MSNVFVPSDSSASTIDLSEYATKSLLFAELASVGNEHLASILLDESSTNTIETDVTSGTGTSTWTMESAGTEEFKIVHSASAGTLFIGSDADNGCTVNASGEFTFNKDFTVYEDGASNSSIRVGDSTGVANKGSKVEMFANTGANSRWNDVNFYKGDGASAELGHYIRHDPQNDTLEIREFTGNGGLIIDNAGAIEVDDSLTIAQSGSTNNLLRFLSNSTQDGEIQFMENSSTIRHQILYDRSENHLYLGPYDDSGAGRDGIRITGSGNVYIGDESGSPGAEAVLRLYANQSGGGGDAHLQLYRNALSGSSCDLSWGSEGADSFAMGMGERVTPYNQLLISCATGGDCIYWRNDATGATYIPSGEVQLINGTTNQIQFNSAQDTSQFLLTHDVSTPYVELTESGGDGLRVDSNGDVTVANSSAATLNIDGGGIGGAGMYLQDDSVTKGYAVYSALSAELAIGNSTSSETMIMADAGGTTFSGDVTVAGGCIRLRGNDSNQGTDTDTINLGAASCGVLELNYSGAGNDTFTVQTTACSSDSLVFIQAYADTSQVEDFWLVTAPSNGSFVITMKPNGSPGTVSLTVQFLVVQTTGSPVSASWG